MKWQGKGIARAVHWNELTEEHLTEVINDVMNNPKYVYNRKSSELPLTKIISSVESINTIDLADLWSL